MATATAPSSPPRCSMKGWTSRRPVWRWAVWGGPPSASTCSAWGASCVRRPASTPCCTSWSPSTRRRPSPARGGAITVLTADLVSARRRGDELRLAPTDDVRRERIAVLAAALTARARQEIGSLRDDVEEALRQTASALEEGDRRLAAAVGKLVRDGLRFEESAGETATELRRELFTEAAARRASGEAPFDRAAFLDAFAGAHATTPAALEAALYADRPGAQRLLAVEVPAPALLAARFEISEAQAILLRATKVVAEVEASDAALYRRLFRTLKFLRLLPVITKVEIGGGYRVEMDGPLSLFQGGGRYGLSLALALPAIAACDRWRLDADVRWGPERRPVRFRLAGETSAPFEAPGDALPEELGTFVAAFQRAATGWKI